VIGTKRVSLEVVAELFCWLVRAWVSSLNMKISASIVVLLGSLPRALRHVGEISVRPIGPSSLMHHIELRSGQRVTSVTAATIFLMSVSCHAGKRGPCPNIHCRQLLAKAASSPLAADPESVRSGVVLRPKMLERSSRRNPPAGNGEAGLSQEEVEKLSATLVVGQFSRIPSKDRCGALNAVPSRSS